MQKEKGITLISLVIIIVIIAILTSTAIYSGTQSLQEAKKTRFITELRMIQEKIKLDEYNVEYGNTIGTDYTAVSNDKREKILASEGIAITNLNDYRYLTKGELEQNLQLSGITRNVLINFETKDVISEQGIKIDGKWCYTLRQAGVEDYTTSYDQTQMKNTISFEISKKHAPDSQKQRDKWNVTLTSITLTDYPQKYEAYYREYDATQSSNANWRRMENNQALIEGGEYEFKIVDSYGNQKIERETFSYFPPLGGELTYKVGTVEDGYVVTDASGNEYVWIPVDGIYGEDSTDAKNKILLGRYQFDSSGNPTAYSGAYKEETQAQHQSSGFTNTIAINIESFINSVRKYNGYYIARFEASQGSNNKAESKASKKVWDNLSQEDASAACQGIYKNFTSDLINSYAWDTALLFIEQKGTKSNSRTYSQEKGANVSNNIQITGNSVLTSTNAVDEQCRIFDLAGNCAEYTTETSDNSTTPVTVRGDWYLGTLNNTANRQLWSPSLQIEGIGFRAILYLAA